MLDGLLKKGDQGHPTHSRQSSHTPASHSWPSSPRASIFDISESRSSGKLDCGNGRLNKCTKIRLLCLPTVLFFGVLAISTALLITEYRTLNRAAEERTQHVLEQATTAYAGDLARSFRDIETLSRSLVNLMEMFPNATAEQWRRTAEVWPQKQINQFMVATWSARVTSATRASYERQHYLIRDWTTKAVLNYTSNSSYLPVTYTAFRETPAAMGKDRLTSQTVGMLEEVMTMNSALLSDIQVYVKLGNSIGSSYARTAYNISNITVVPPAQRPQYALGVAAIFATYSDLISTHASLLLANTIAVLERRKRNDPWTFVTAIGINAAGQLVDISHSYDPGARHLAIEHLPWGGFEFRLTVQAEAGFTDEHGGQFRARETLVIVGILALLILVLFGIDIRLRYSRHVSLVREMNLVDKAKREVERRKEAELTTQAKQHFLSYVFHETRVPFNAVVLGLENLSRLNLPEQAHNFISMALDSARHVSKILNDVLDLQRIKEGKLTLSVTEVKLDTVVQKVLHLFQQPAADKGVTLEYEYHGTVAHETVYADSKMLVQCLSNYVSNAIKFTESAGRVCVHVSRLGLESNDVLDDLDDVFLSDDPVPRSTSGDMSESGPSSSSGATVEVLLAVSDTGSGIAKEHQDKLFQPFAQAPNAVSGSGLGLSLVRKMIDLHHGTVGLRSNQGLGSVFYMALPLRLADSPEEQESKFAIDSEEPTRQREDSTDASHLKGRHVLVVEDSAFSRELLVCLLTSLGLTCAEAENGQVAVDMVAACPDKERLDWDLIIMDQEMPVLDGVAATQQIRQMGVSVPIFSLSGNAFPADIKKFVDAGITHTLSKPFQVAEFVRLTRSHFPTLNIAV